MEKQRKQKEEKVRKKIKDGEGGKIEGGAEKTGVHK